MNQSAMRPGCRRRPSSGLSPWPVCDGATRAHDLRHRRVEDPRLVGVRHCGDVLRDVRHEGADRVRGREGRDRDQDVAGLRTAEPVLPVLRVAEVIGRRDQHHQRQGQGREAELPLQAADVSVQQRVGEQARKHGEQQRVDERVTDAAPGQLEDEIRAMRTSCRVFGVDDVEDEERGEQHADPEAPPPAVAEDFDYRHVLDPDIACDRGERDREVAEIEDVVLERRARRRRDTAPGTRSAQTRANQAEVPGGLRNGARNRMRIRRHEHLSIPSSWGSLPLTRPTRIGRSADPSVPVFYGRSFSIRHGEPPGYRCGVVGS